MKPRVLMIAYACNPEGSGEHWLGWGWAEQAAENFSVHLLTTTNHRAQIEKHAPRHGITLHFVSLPDRLHQVSERLGGGGRWLRKIVWQSRAAKLAERLHAQEKFQLVHQTTFHTFRVPFLAARLGIPVDNVDVVHGDTGRVPFGMGTYGSRSISVGGAAIMKALDKIETKAKKIAAHLMEASDADIEFANGEFTVKGTDKKIPFGQVALTAYVPHNYPLDKLEPGLNENAFYDPTNFTYPSGSYICEVEVDPETGRTTVEKFTAVDDFGKLVNPLIVAGQVHGGLAQGLGQAMLEGCVYDSQSGQLLTGSYMDYTMPRADDLPNFVVDHTVTPCTHNPLGVKGCGEAGAFGSPPAFINALTDALGVKDMTMPATAERVWRAALNVA